MLDPAISAGPIEPLDKVLEWLPSGYPLGDLQSGSSSAGDSTCSSSALHAERLVRPERERARARRARGSTRGGPALPAPASGRASACSGRALAAGPWPAHQDGCPPPPCERNPRPVPGEPRTGALRLDTAPTPTRDPAAPARPPSALTGNRPPRRRPASPLLKTLPEAPSPREGVGGRAGAPQRRNGLTPALPYPVPSPKRACCPRRFVVH